MTRSLTIACLLLFATISSSQATTLEQIKNICTCEKVECQKELFSYLSDSDEYIRSYAASCLEKQKSVDSALLESAVNSKDGLVLAGALRIYAKHGRCTDLLGSYLTSESAILRAQAAYAIGGLKCEKFEQPLIDLLWDRNVSVRVRAIDALGEIAKPSSLSKIIEFLNSPHGQIAQATIKAVIKYQDQAVEPLKKTVLNGERTELRARAAVALAAIMTKSSTKALSEILDSRDKDAVGAALFALRYRKDKSLAQKIQKYLQDSYEFGRYGKLSELAKEALENQQ